MLAWQILFLVIASNPQRYRAMIPVAFLETLGFGAAAIALFLQQRVHASVRAFGLVDLVLGALFLLCSFAALGQRPPAEELR